MWRGVIWVSWSCIYSSCLLRLYLCFQRLYSFLLLLRTGQNLHLIPGTERTSVRVCVSLTLVSHFELLAVFLTKIYSKKFMASTGMMTIPFLVLQDCLVVTVSMVLVAVLLFSEIWRVPCRAQIRATIFQICLISVSSVVTNLLTFYGDILCTTTDNLVTEQWLVNLKPHCFIPLAKTLTYFDSLLFPVILFTGANMRKSALQLICGMRHLHDPPAAQEPLMQHPANG